MAVEDIVAAVDAQYVEELKEDYVSYKNQPINTMIEQLQKYYVITTKYKIAIKAHFLEPWSDMPDACATTFKPSTGQVPRRMEGPWGHSHLG